MRRGLQECVVAGELTLRWRPRRSGVYWHHPVIGLEAPARETCATAIQSLPIWPSRSSERQSLNDKGARFAWREAILSCDFKPGDGWLTDVSRNARRVAQNPVSRGAEGGLATRGLITIVARRGRGLVTELSKARLPTWWNCVPALEGFRHRLAARRLRTRTPARLWRAFLRQGEEAACLGEYRGASPSERTSFTDNSPMPGSNRVWRTSMRTLRAQDALTLRRRSRAPGPRKAGASHAPSCGAVLDRDEEMAALPRRAVNVTAVGRDHSKRAG